ncbi:hypothetical protein AAG570_001574 [Ranatra chinensis]|uniref:Uncharacterized protein n=1 Tax=Ranatra chinensis TaxID=642074 RepID=A0ABD0YVG9_9HEMI
MASKRRNMFHKNKTQETTEEAIDMSTPVALVSCLLLAVSTGRAASTPANGVTDFSLQFDMLVGLLKMGMAEEGSHDTRVPDFHASGLDAQGVTLRDTATFKRNGPIYMTEPQVDYMTVYGSVGFGNLQRSCLGRGSCHCSQKVKEHSSDMNYDPDSRLAETYSAQTDELRARDYRPWRDVWCPVPSSSVALVVDPNRFRLISTIRSSSGSYCSIGSGGSSCSGDSSVVVVVEVVMAVAVVLALNVSSLRMDGRTFPALVTVGSNSIDFSYTLEHKSKRGCVTRWSKLVVAPLGRVTVRSGQAPPTEQDMTDYFNREILPEMNTQMASQRFLARMGREFNFCISRFFPI